MSLTKLPEGDLSGYTFHINNYVGSLIPPTSPHTWITVVAPDGQVYNYGFGPAVLGQATVAGPGIIRDETGDPITISSVSAQLSPEHYGKLSHFINGAIDNPPFYNAAQGQECTNWVYEAINTSFGIDANDFVHTCPAGLQPTLANIFVTFAYNPIVSSVVQFEDSVGQNIASLWTSLGKFSNQLLNQISTFPNDGAKSLGDFVSLIAAFFNRTQTDPIVLDLSAGGTGVELTSLANSNASFDLLNNGFATHTGWVGPTTGLLVRDANNNGVVDNITELFGDTNTDGFTALKAVDSNHDGNITAADSAFASLKVWTDTDGDGVTDAGELHTLTELGITAINISATPHNENVNGNTLGAIASFTRSDNSTGQVAEAFFDNSRLEATFTGS